MITNGHDLDFNSYLKVPNITLPHPKIEHSCSIVILKEGYYLQNYMTTFCNHLGFPLKFLIQELTRYNTALLARSDKATV